MLGWIDRRATAIALSFVAMTFVLGCGGDDDSSSGATATPTADAAPPTPTAITAPAGPGLVAEITDASVGADDQIVVDFFLTDAMGQPVQPTLTATQNPQQARVRLTAARLESYSGGGGLANTFERYVNIVNETRPGYDSNGVLETIDAATGVYRFTFSVALEQGHSQAATYSVAMQADRNVSGRTFSANPVFDFTPSGDEPGVRAGVTTAQCNTCHDPLQVHGTRFEVRLCNNCHTEAAVDELGRSIDMRDMIHKIHAGVDLPSVADGPPGSSYGIFSGFQQADIVFARKDDDGVVSGISFPRPLSDCTACHVDAPTAQYHLEKASTAACSSCHDDVNPSLEDTGAGAPGTNHFQNRGYAEGQCAACHTADLGEEFDISVPGAHTIPERSAQLAGLNIAIEGIADHMASQTPLVTFKITNDAGAPLTDLSGLNRLAFILAGPTDEYEHLTVATAVGGGAGGTLTGPNGQGQFQYRLPAALPDDAAGTWSLGAEARRSVMVSERSVNEAAVNPVVTFSTDDATAAVRREVVSNANCTSCHGEFSKGFSIHGNLRNQVEMCVLCHNPNETDFARRGRDPEAVAMGDLNETIDFKVMIHKIHRGEHLEQHPYLLYGFGAAPANFTAHDFSHVLYPGDLRNCDTCHLPGTYMIPPFPGDGALGSLLTAIDPVDGSEFEVGRLGPITSACTSCHDSDESLAHADTQTADGGSEACSVCHSETRPHPVSALHAR